MQHGKNVITLHKSYDSCTYAICITKGFTFQTFPLIFYDHKIWLQLTFYPRCCFLPLIFFKFPFHFVAIKLIQIMLLLCGYKIESETKMWKRVIYKINRGIISFDRICRKHFLHHSFTIFPPSIHKHSLFFCFLPIFSFHSFLNGWKLVKLWSHVIKGSAFLLIIS